MESDLENEKYSRDEAQRTADSHLSSLNSLRQTLSGKEEQTARLERDLAEMATRMGKLEKSEVRLYITVQI